MVASIFALRMTSYLSVLQTEENLPRFPGVIHTVRLDIYRIRHKNKVHMFDSCL